MRIIIFSFIFIIFPPNVLGQEKFVNSMNREFSLSPYQAEDLNDVQFKTKTAFIFSLLTNTTELRIHQFNGASKNEVHIFTRDEKEGGGYPEIVVRFDFDENGQKIDGTGAHIQDCENRASFNYKHPEMEPLGHFAEDILPWIELGNCREDTTTREQRLSAYVEDIKLGLERLIDANSGYFLPVNFSLSESGQSETIAFFIQAFENVDFDLYGFILNEDNTFDNKNKFYQALELGINRNFE